MNYNVYSTVTSISSDSSYSVYDTVSSTAVTSSKKFNLNFSGLQTALTQLGGSQDELHLNIGKLESPGVKM